ncbi:MAG: CotH kinase family protein [Granulosicoccus sp.]
MKYLIARKKGIEWSYSRMENRLCKIISTRNCLLLVTCLNLSACDFGSSGFDETTARVEAAPELLEDPDVGVDPLTPYSPPSVEGSQGDDVPANGAPDDDTPVDEPAGEDTPVDEPAGEDAPLDEPAGEDAPLDEPAGEDAPIDEPAGENEPVDEPLGENEPVDEPLGENEPVDEPPGDDPLPDDEAPDEMSDTVFSPSETDIRDRVSVYQEDGYAVTDVIRIDLKTVTADGICQEDDMSGCTLSDVMEDTDSRDDFKVDIKVHFSATDFADDGSMNNAELRQRGGGSRLAPQKSFRIKLDDADQLWRGERHLQLNKHPFENSRIRNKLSFDLMRTMPHIASFRTQFVNLWIDDGEGPVDYGLFTHVERADKRYLDRHGLDDDARLYKAEFFRFRESDRKTLLIDEDGKPLDKDLFESVLEIQNGKDHRNLIAMLEALHDPDQSFDSVMDRHFNENNVLTWIAMNLLIGQKDATRHNYFLYNPEDSETFYFLPWDYDYVFQEHEEPANEFTPDSLRARLRYGYAVGSRNEFLNSYYRRQGAHERIIAAADQLRETYLSDTTIAERATSLASITYPYVSAPPDIANNPFYSDRSSADFASKVAFNYDAMLNRFNVPLPPTMAEPILESENWLFSWIPAHELTGHELTYDLQIGTSPEFLPDDIAVLETGIENTGDVIEYRVDVERLPAGVEHYARLIARSVIQPERYWQVADNEIVIDDVTYYGVVKF